MLADLGVGWLDVGAGGIVILAIYMIFTARLVPQKYYDEALSRVEHERTEKDKWRTAAEKLLEQNTLLLQRDDVSLTTLRAIRTSVDEGRDT